MKNLTKVVLGILALALVLMAACTNSSQQKAELQKFTIMESIYVGWMPWYYAAEKGVVQRWADKYGIKIEFVPADYIESINAYVAGKADGVVMTNMEALNMAAAAGVDSTAIIIGDYSNGNDAVLTRNKLGLCDLKGKQVSIVELSVSQYLLGRGLETACQGRISERDMTLVNTSDSDIASVFIANKSQQVVVTWNPMVLEIVSQAPDVTRAYDSSKIPEEILDILFLNTRTLATHPELAKALSGAWYETLALMQGKGGDSDQALAYMAERSGTTVESYNKQLGTTHMYWAPSDARAFARSSQLVTTMDLVRKFSFDHGLWQDAHASSIDAIGMSFPGGRTLGDKNNVKLRFDDTYMTKQ